MGPLKPSSACMPRMAPLMFVSMYGTVNGDTFLIPLVFSAITLSSYTCMPPIALPTKTPHRVLSTASRSAPHRPASRSALLPAQMAYWWTLSMRLASFAVRSVP